MSIEETEKASAAVALDPQGRVSLDDIKRAIKAEYFVTADQAVNNSQAVPELKLMTLCFLVMQNGFVVVGKSAPASPVNFNAELGNKLAYEDAIRQVWPLMGYAKRDELMRNSASKT